MKKRRACKKDRKELPGLFVFADGRQKSVTRGCSRIRPEGTLHF